MVLESASNVDIALVGDISRQYIIIRVQWNSVWRPYGSEPRQDKRAYVLELL